MNNAVCCDDSEHSDTNSHSKSWMTFRRPSAGSGNEAAFLSAESETQKTSERFLTKLITNVCVFKQLNKLNGFLFLYLCAVFLSLWIYLHPTSSVCWTRLSSHNVYRVRRRTHRLIRRTSSDIQVCAIIISRCRKLLIKKTLQPSAVIYKLGQCILGPQAGGQRWPHMIILSGHKKSHRWPDSGSTGLMWSGFVSPAHRPHTNFLTN